MLNQLTIGENPNKKNIESLDLTRKENLLWLWKNKFCNLATKVENET